MLLNLEALDIEMILCFGYKSPLKSGHRQRAERRRRNGLASCRSVIATIQPDARKYPYADHFGSPLEDRRIPAISRPELYSNIALIYTLLYKSFTVKIEYLSIYSSSMWPQAIYRSKVGHYYATTTIPSSGRNCPR